MIYYVQGDATKPQECGLRYITHIVNDKGGWGRGFVCAISRRWPEPEARYRQWFRSREGFELGAIQIVSVSRDIHVINMLAQEGYDHHRRSDTPLRYEALKRCLQQVATKAADAHASIHMPRIGCSLAGGCWSNVEPLIRDTLSSRGLRVFVYDLPGSFFRP